MSKQGPETKLIARCRKRAREKYGYRLVDIKYHGDIYAEAGVSDLLHCLDGVFVAIEMKAPESYGGSVERAVQKGPTVKQRLFIDHVNEAGGVGGVAASEDQYMDLLEVAEFRAQGGIRSVT